MDQREERGLLDTVRWISAGMVAFGHAWVSLFARQDTLISRALWALADTRHAWVIIFFVMSGYLVGGGVLLRADRFDFRRYALARFSRIYIVLIPALLLTATLDGTAHMLAPHSPVYTDDNWAEQVFGPPAPFAHYTPAAVLVSILCLQSASGLGPPMGSDGPLWSLGFEWIFYFAFPALLLSADAAARRLRLSLCLSRGLMLLLSVAILIATHKPYAAILWLIWVGGAVARLVVEKGRWPLWLRWAGAGLCLAGFVAQFHINYRFADPLIGLGAASFLALYPQGERGLKPALDRTLAGGSYTLYIIHLPVLAFVTMLFNRQGWLLAGGAPMGWSALAMSVGAALAVGVVTVAFHRLFEARTDQLRAVLYRRL